MSRKRRWSWLIVLAAAGGVLGIWSAGQSADPRAEKKPDEKPIKAAKAKSTNAALLKKLQEPINFVKDIEANSPLKDALDYISNHHDFTFVIDRVAFQKAREEVGPEIEAEPVKLSHLSKMTVGTALRLILSDVNATFIVRQGFIEVTTPEAAAPGALLQRKVTASFDRVPLTDALQKLSEHSGVSVLVDERAAEKAQSPVKATLKNDVSVETAVRLLADMAGLKAVRVGGSLYVTTRENAATLQAEEKKRRKAEKRQAKEVEKAKIPAKENK